MYIIYQKPIKIKFIEGDRTIEKFIYNEEILILFF